MDPHVRLKSTWKDAIGRPLTDRAIVAYARLGYFKGRLTLRQPTAAASFIVNRCGCGSLDAVWRTYAYLPKPGFYCSRCLAVHRAERDKAAAQAKRWKELLLKEYV